MARRKHHHKYHSHRRHSIRHRHNETRKHFSSGCSFCGGDLEGLPHSCKYCGEIHCSKHLLPESHECSGLEHPKKFPLFGGKEREKTNSFFINPFRSNSTSQEVTLTPSRHRFDSLTSERVHHKSKFRLPQIRFPRLRRSVKTFLIAWILAIVTYFLAASYIGNSTLLWIETIAWIYFTWIIYRGAFRWANRVSMADDLAFWGLRILGGFVVFIGLYVGFAVLFASFFVNNSAPLAIPLGCLLFGLILLGAFIAFRTNRRHNVVGIWRA